MNTYCFGIDVGGTSVKLGLFTTDGDLLEKWEIPTRTENKGEAILGDIAAALRDKMQERHLSVSQMAGAGIGVPGPVNREGEIRGAVNLGWGLKPVRQELEMLTGLKVCAANDANAAALGEVWQGSAAGYDSIIFVTLGTGIGGGIIVDGHIVTGAHGAAGEIGHAHVNHDEQEFCNCGNQGCLEQVASAPGLVRLAREALEETDEASLLRQRDHLTAKDVLDVYQEGDQIAAGVVEQYADYLGSALSSFVVVVDPDAILIGGGVSRAGEPLIRAITRYYRKYAFSLCKNIPVLLAQLGNDAGIYGAARLVL